MSIIKKIGILSLGQGINILVNLLFLPYMARVLSQIEYGTYGQVILVVSFTGAMLTFGLPKIIFIYLSDLKLKTRAVLFNNLLASFVLGAFGVVILVLFGDIFSGFFNNEKVGYLIKIFSISLLFSIPNQSINSFLIYTNRVKANVALIVFTNLLKIGLVVIAIQVYSSIEYALIGIIISQFIFFVVGMHLIRKNIHIKFNRPLFFEQIKKGFPLGLTGFVGTAMLYTDGVMISAFKGVEEYAIYRNGAIELPFIATVYASISMIILPEISKLYGAGEFKRIAVLKKKVIMNTIMFTYPIFIFLCFNYNELITSYLGVRYADSAPIFLVFNIVLLIRVNDYSDILISGNKGRKILLFYSIAFVLNIALNYTLINTLGPIGAAISTVLSIILLASLQFSASLKLINTKVKEFVNVKHIIIVVLFSLLLSFIIKFGFVISNHYNLLIWFFIYFPIIYLFLFWRGYFSKEIIIRLLPGKIQRFILKK